jgi:hypothetical protein
MKIKCPCGQNISDNTDEISYKGHVFADQDYFTILEGIESCIQLVASNSEALEKAKNDADDVIISKTRGIWTCDNCGRVAIHDASCQLHWYKPENGENVQNLLSTREKNYVDDGT